LSINKLNKSSNKKRDPWPRADAAGAPIERPRLQNNTTGHATGARWCAAMHGNCPGLAKAATTFGAPTPLCGAPGKVVAAGLIKEPRTPLTIAGRGNNVCSSPVSNQFQS